MALRGFRGLKRGAALLFALCLALPLGGAGAEEAPLRVAVAADLHYLAPELTDGGPYFQALIRQADGKVTQYSEELVQAFVEQIIRQGPDALILCGDLTFNGERASHLALAQKLDQVRQAGIPVYVLPGNHDLNAAAARFEGEGYQRVDSVTAEEFAQIYGVFGFEQALSRDSHSLSYTVQLGEGVRLLMVDVNTSWAPGQVLGETYLWIQEQLAQAQQAGCRVVAASHQNLLDHSGLLSSGFTIENGERLRALYAQAPVVCNLSGHIHLQHTACQGKLWDIATASLAVSPNQYGLLTLSPQGAAYQTQPVDVSAWARAQGLEDPALLDFAAYARDFFQDTARRQALSAAAQDQDPGQLAEYFAQVNLAYFSGRLDLCPRDSALQARWRAQSSFLSSYIDSILQEPARNHCRWSLAF